LIKGGSPDGPHRFFEAFLSNSPYLLDCVPVVFDMIFCCRCSAGPFSSLTLYLPRLTDTRILHNSFFFQWSWDNTFTFPVPLAHFRTHCPPSFSRFLSWPSGPQEPGSLYRPLPPLCFKGNSPNNVFGSSCVTFLSNDET